MNGMSRTTRRIRPAVMTAALTSLLLVAGSGCGWVHFGRAQPFPRIRPQVVVVAPVLNLSDSPHVDVLKVTDTVASELLSFQNVSVIPVNLTLAALARRGMVHVETPEDAIDLAEEFGADATLVTAITEFDPYDPPVIGLVMQWYAVPTSGLGSSFDPVAASRQAGIGDGAELSAGPAVMPRLQVQRVFNAANNDVLEEMRQFAKRRGGHQSPHGWRRWSKSQELYIRYSTNALIHSILRLHEAEFSATTTEVPS